MTTTRLQTNESFFTRHPDAVSFREAIQNPRAVLSDGDLQNAEVVCDRRGLPIAYTGRSAVVFRLRTPAGDWALRCFTQTAHEERRVRYTAIAACLADHPRYFVPFRYLERGIRIGAAWFPVVAMRWAKGETLGRFVDSHQNDPAALRRLAQAVSDLLTDLEWAGIAHGDWQHDNLLVSPEGQIALVDYDGLFVPELAGCLSPELGHPNYQHPARTSRHYGPGLDRFSCLVLQTGLLAVAAESSLWTRFNDGESVLFKKQDFLDPAASPVFRAVRAIAGRDARLREGLGALEAACASDFHAVTVPAGPVNAPTDFPVASGANMVNAWWLTSEVDAKPTNATSPVFTKEAIAGTRFLDRLASEEVCRAEKRYLWFVRLGYLGMITILAGSLVSLFDGRPGFFPFWFFVHVFGFANGGYQRWPRKKVHHELGAEIVKLEKLVEERHAKITKSRFVLEPLPHRMAPANFVEAWLELTSISKILTVPGISITALRHLRAAHVNTAADLRGRTQVAGVAPHEMAALHNWCSQLEVEAASEFQKTGHAPAGTSGHTRADLTRWENEVAAFETELEMLKHEKALFPDVGGITYLRKLLGLKTGP